MMNTNLIQAMGRIDPKLIADAAPDVAHKKSVNKTWVKWASAVAACLSLIIMGGALGNVFRSPDATDNSIVSYFVITAHAENGDLTELGVTENCFNSITSQENVFGVDMPLFDFSVQPSDLKGNEVLYSKFDISISYNGTEVEGKDEHIMDEHIMVAYDIPTPNSNEPWAYSITGWFTEPTDIIITIIDTESHEIVETIAVNVDYIVDMQGYELEITNLTTKFSEQK